MIWCCLYKEYISFTMRHLLSAVYEFGLKFAKNQYIHIFTLSSLKIYVIKIEININSNIDKNKKYMSIKYCLLEYTRWYWQVPAIVSPDRLPDSNHVREHMDCLMMIFMDMLQNNFLHFLAYCWWLVIRNASHHEVTFYQPWNSSHSQNLKNVCQKSDKAFWRFQ